MKVRAHIISRLEAISQEMPEIMIRYAYDEVLHFHIVEIGPEEVRRGNEIYMRFESKLWTEFYELSSDQDLIVANPCDTHDMSNILYEKNASGLISEGICHAAEPEL